MRLHNTVLIGLALAILSGMPSLAATNFNPKITSVKTYRKIGDYNYVEDNAFWNRKGVNNQGGMLMEQVFFGVTATGVESSTRWNHSVKRTRDNVAAGSQNGIVFDHKIAWSPTEAVKTADGFYLEEHGTYKITATIVHNGETLSTMAKEFLMVDIDSLNIGDMEVGGTRRAGAIRRPSDRDSIWELIDPSNLGVTFVDGSTSITTSIPPIVRAGNKGGNYTLKVRDSGATSQNYIYLGKQGSVVEINMDELNPKAVPIRGLVKATATSIPSGRNIRWELIDYSNTGAGIDEYTGWVTAKTKGGTVIVKAKDSLISAAYDTRVLSIVAMSLGLSPATIGTINTASNTSKATASITPAGHRLKWEFVGPDLGCKFKDGATVASQLTTTNTTPLILSGTQGGNVTVKVSDYEQSGVSTTADLQVLGLDLSFSPQRIYNFGTGQARTTVSNPGRPLRWEIMTNTNPPASFIVGANTRLAPAPTPNTTIDVAGGAYNSTLGGAYGDIVIKVADAGFPAIYTTAPASVVEMILDPITQLKTGATLTPMNSGGIPLNGSMQYQVIVNPPTLPNSDITWSSNNANVTFVGGNTGRIVTARGAALGSSQLKCSITGGPTLAPTRDVNILNPINIPINIYIIRHSVLGAAWPIGTVLPMLNRVNEIYKQMAVTFTIQGTQWLDNDAYWAVNRNTIGTMFDTNTPNTIELYLVGDVTDAQGWNWYSGCTVEPGVRPDVLAHELGHACGLNDIYNSRPGLNPPMVIAAGLDIARNHAPLDWNNSPGREFWTPRLTQRDLNQMLIMYGDGDAGGRESCFPRGRVLGLWYDKNQYLFPDQDVWHRGPSAVGQLDFTRNPIPTHR